MSRLLLLLCTGAAACVFVDLCFQLVPPGEAIVLILASVGTGIAAGTFVVGYSSRSKKAIHGHRERGQGAAEFVLIVAIFALATLAAMSVVSSDIISLFSSIASTLPI